MSFGCDLCDRVAFSLKWQLNRHKKDLHGETIYCEFCAMPFRNKKSVVRHQAKSCKAVCQEDARGVKFQRTGMTQSLQTKAADPHLYLRCWSTDCLPDKLFHVLEPSDQVVFGSGDHSFEALSRHVKVSSPLVDHIRNDLSKTGIHVATKYLSCTKSFRWALDFCHKQISQDASWKGASIIEIDVQMLMKEAVDLEKHIFDCSSRKAQAKHCDGWSEHIKSYALESQEVVFDVDIPACAISSVYQINGTKIHDSEQFIKDVKCLTGENPDMDDMYIDMDLKKAHPSARLDIDQFLSNATSALLNQLDHGELDNDVNDDDGCDDASTAEFGRLSFSFLE